MPHASMAAACFVVGAAFLCPAAQTTAESTRPTPHAFTATMRSDARKVQLLVKLREVQAVGLTGPGPEGAQTWIPCSSGDIYASLDTSKPGPGLRQVPSPRSMPVRRISVGSGEVSLYNDPLSLGNYGSVERAGFNVDRWGALYGLYLGYRHALDPQRFVLPDYLIAKFDHDGSVASWVRLKDPPGGRLDPSVFDVFGNGNLLVTGTLDAKPPASRSGLPTTRPLRIKIVHQTPPGLHPFTGIFDSSGNFIEELRLPGDVGRNRAASAQLNQTPSRGAAKGLSPNSPFGGSLAHSWPMAMMGTLMITAPDGTIYLLRPSNPAMLYQISDDGRVLRQAEIKVPQGASAPTDASMAGSSDIFVEFYGQTIGKNRQVHSTTVYAMVDPLTGKIAGMYRLPSKDFGLFAACADSSSEILFLGSTKAGNLELVKFSTE